MLNGNVNHSEIIHNIYWRSIFDCMRRNLAESFKFIFIKQKEILGFNLILRKRRVNFII